jgi:hypothetical protein
MRRADEAEIRTNPFLTNFSLTFKAVSKRAGVAGGGEGSSASATGGSTYNTTAYLLVLADPYLVEGLFPAALVEGKSEEEDSTCTRQRLDQASVLRARAAGTPCSDAIEGDCRERVEMRNIQGRGKREVTDPDKGQGALKGLIERRQQGLREGAQGGGRYSGPTPEQEG